MRVKEKLDNIRQSHFDIKLVPKNIGQLSKRYYEGPSGDADYGQMTVGQYVQRPEFELFDMKSDPHESTNLADSPGHQDILKQYQAKLKSMQKEMEDPWIMKWEYE